MGGGIQRVVAPLAASIHDQLRPWARGRWTRRITHALQVEEMEITTAWSTSRLSMEQQQQII